MEYNDNFPRLGSQLVSMLQLMLNSGNSFKSVPEEVKTYSEQWEAAFKEIVSKHPPKDPETWKSLLHSVFLATLLNNLLSNFGQDERMLLGAFASEVFNQMKVYYDKSKQEI